jgi:hypothetical protein
VRRDRGGDEAHPRHAVLRTRHGGRAPRYVELALQPRLDLFVEARPFRLLLARTSARYFVV